MRELHDLVRAYREASREGARLLLATVVRVSGSTYRRPGARLLLSEERWLAGAVSGGCLERDLVQKAWWRTSSGAPALVVYDASAPEDGIGWSLGLGCDGAVHVLLERLDPDDPVHPLAFLRARLELRTPGVLATVFRADPAAPARPGDRLALEGGEVRHALRDGALAAGLAREAERALAAGATRAVELGPAGARVEALVEHVPPPLELAIFGGGADVVPLAELGRALGWSVTLVAPRRTAALRAAAPWARVVTCAPADAAREVPLGPGAAAIVMSHDLAADAGYLAAVLASPAFHVGVLGPRARTERLLAGLGLAPPWPARLRFPVGLDLGAEGPEEIALAIASELQAVRAGATAAPLTGRDAPIHPRPAAGDAAPPGPGGSRR